MSPVITAFGGPFDGSLLLVNPEFDEHAYPVPNVSGLTAYYHLQRSGPRLVFANRVSFTYAGLRFDCHEDIWGDVSNSSAPATAPPRLMRWVVTVEGHRFPADPLSLRDFDAGGEFVRRMVQATKRSL